VKRGARSQSACTRVQSTLQSPIYTNTSESQITTNPKHLKEEEVENENEEVIVGKRVNTFSDISPSKH